MNNEEWLKKAKILAGEYAHCYSFVGDDTVHTAQNALFSHLEMMTKPSEPSQHAALIAQCAQDKIDYPKFWRKLIQCKTHLCKWHDQSNYAFKFENIPSFEYRQHPHRESIILWYGCSDADKLRWQVSALDNVWIDWNIEKCGIPDFDEFYQYRLRPRTCKVTIQGKVLEYPEPCRELGFGQKYYAIMLADGTIRFDTWSDHYCDFERLKNNVIHLTEQAAQQHLEVLKAVNAQVAE